MKCVGESEKRINYGAYQSLCAIELKKLFGAAAIHWPKRIEYMFAHRRLTTSIIRNIKTTNAHICLSYFRFSSIFHFVFVQFYWRLLNAASYPLRCNRRALFLYIYIIFHFIFCCCLFFPSNRRKFYSAMFRSILYVLYQYSNRTDFTDYLLVRCWHFFICCCCCRSICFQYRSRKYIQCWV